MHAGRGRRRRLAKKRRQARREIQIVASQLGLSEKLVLGISQEDAVLLDTARMWNDLNARVIVSVKPGDIRE